ncbi:arylsulfotransferase family protein [Maribacter sp.]|uniref:arylsulfotransferase family protein n=1 Tax=Maribacter sp. TaxID=1897614 RepID=UPI0025C1B07E|nr:aryl-sulfate sulfotransferase [Maribacter sp.]
MKNYSKVKLFLAFISITLISCNSDDNEPISTIEFPTKEGLEVFNAARVYDGLVLVNDASANRVYLMDKRTDIKHEWNLNGKRLGNDAKLLDDGRLLSMFESLNPEITLGGFGGLISMLDKNGNVDWSYEYSNENHIAHHDTEVLPNGNILFLSWEKKSIEDANEIGFSQETEIIYDAILEIDPKTNEIVWEWHMWDHIIQDFDETRLNFGDVQSNPNKIDINYLEVKNEFGDVSHANGIDYDADKDLIFLSVNYYSEIWIIDHSTTTAQAKTSKGGNYNLGGDLIYRFGNPSAYKNQNGTRLFDRNHHPNLLEGEKKGNILIYSNGINTDQSTVYELKIPENFNLESNQNNEPEVVWSFTDPDLFAGRVSGADILPNGNVLITEGDFGFWEVSNNGEILWRYNTLGFFWRGYHFDYTDSAIINLDLPTN